MNLKAVKFLSYMAPRWSGKFAYRMMATPVPHEIRKQEREILATAKKKKIAFKNIDIQAYIWGEENSETIFFIHGWAGNAGNFAMMIDVLKDSGYRLITFDAPSHGESSRGTKNMFEFSDFLSMMLKKYKPSVLVSHSFGNVNAIMALQENQDIVVDHWILIAPPHDFMERVNLMSEFLGLTPTAKKYLIKELEKQTGKKIDNLTTKWYGSQLKNVNKSVIFHSKNDKIISIDSARNTSQNLPNSELIELERYGHSSILWSSDLRGLTMEIAISLKPADK